MRNQINYNESFLQKLISLLQKAFIGKKFNNKIGYLFVVAIAVGFGFLMATNMVAGLGLFVGVLGVLLVIICLSSPEAGLYIVATFAFLAAFISRLFFKEQLQVGTIVDSIVILSTIGLFTSRTRVKENFQAFTKSALVVFIFCTLFYNAIQFVNPNAFSPSTNILALRKFFGYVCIMFIAFSVFDTFERAKRYFTFIFFLCCLTAIYGCIQEVHGYFNFEMELIMADPIGFGLIFVGGHFRKFSTMSDPTSFGIIMSVSAIFFSIIAIYEKNKKKRFVLLAGVLLMLFAMSFSGTRTANAALVGGIFFFILLDFERKSTRIFGITLACVLSVILFGPFYGNSTIARFRTTFFVSKDESFLVRERSRAFIQPYILSHPIGGGLGTTGFAGARDHPGHFLGGFMPDSSYVKRAAETGWIGLAITCYLYFLTLKFGLQAFFRTKAKQFRPATAACVSALFAFYVAEFAQVAVGGIADVMIYYPILAVILKFKVYDKDAATATTDA